MVGTQTETEAILEQCGTERRRRVLETLAAQTRAMTVDELADAIAEGDPGRPRVDGPDGSRSEIRIALHHLDLPSLDEAGLVAYDDEANLAEPTARFVRGASQLSAGSGHVSPLTPPLDP